MDSFADYLEFLSIGFRITVQWLHHRDSLIRIHIKKKTDSLSKFMNKTP